MAVYDGVVEAFALRLASNSTSEEEFLGKTRITTAIAKSIAKSLAKNTTMRRFGLYSNNLSVDGICAIVTALGENSTVEEFHLWRNSTGHRGAMALADTLKRNTTLKIVTLSCNDILVKGSRAIAQALRRNTTLVEIGIGGNEIDFKSFARSLKSNTSLSAINLSGNVFAGVGSDKVASAFGTDEESEQPAYVNIGTEGARALLSALRVNTTVTTPPTPPTNLPNHSLTRRPPDHNPRNLALCAPNASNPSAGHVPRRLPFLHSKPKTHQTLRRLHSSPSSASARPEASSPRRCAST